MEKAACVRKEAVAPPEEATPILTTPEKEPETQENTTVGEEATSVQSAMDYCSQFKAMPAQKHWICLKNYSSSSVFGKQKVEPVVKDETPEMVKPTTVESR